MEGRARVDRGPRCRAGRGPQSGPVHDVHEQCCSHRRFGGPGQTSESPTIRDQGRQISELTRPPLPQQLCELIVLQIFHHHCYRRRSVSARLGRCGLIDPGRQLIQRIVGDRPPGKRVNPPTAERHQQTVSGAEAFDQCGGVYASRLGGFRQAPRPARRRQSNADSVQQLLVAVFALASHAYSKSQLPNRGSGSP
jgi:hypothetical protein